MVTGRGISFASKNSMAYFGLDNTIQEGETKMAYLCHWEELEQLFGQEIVVSVITRNV